MKILKYFKTSAALKYFMKFVIFIIKWHKTFKNMIKVYEVNYIMLFIHNNRYIPLTGLLTLYCLKKYSWKFWNISEIFHEIFHKIFHAKKKSWNFTSLIVTKLKSSILLSVHLSCCDVDVPWAYISSGIGVGSLFSADNLLWKSSQRESSEAGFSLFFGYYKFIT